MKFEYISLIEFITEILVVCPSCGSKAIVTSSHSDTWQAEFLCLQCLSHKTWGGDPNSFVTAYSNYEQHEGMLFGPPLDCFFRYPLWYQIPCKNEVLYAYNFNHLNWLEQYVDAKLRERTQTEHGWHNSSLQSRLPQWILSTKNRNIVLKKIAELKGKQNSMQP